MTKYQVVPMINVFMGDVSDTQIIQKKRLFVNAIKVGLDDIVIFHTLAVVQLIPHALVCLLTIDRYVFVLYINLVLDVFLPIQHVKQMIIQHA
jgi:hypothetical protein